MTAVVFGPYPAGSTGTASILDGEVTVSDLITTHVYKNRLYWTVIKA